MPASACKTTLLLQLPVLGFGLLKDGDVGVGIFPEREEIFVSGECADAGGIGIRSLRWRRPSSLGFRHLGSLVPCSGLRPRPRVPPPCCRTPLHAEQHSSAILPRFLCRRLARRNPSLAVLIPAFCASGPPTPRYRTV